MVRSRLATVAVALLSLGLLFQARDASAGIFFDVNVTTQLSVSNSSAGTFAPGDMLTGFIELGDAAGMPSAMLTASDILSFSFSAGTLTLTSADAMNVDFSATVSAGGDSFDMFRLLFTTPGPAGGCGQLCFTDFGRFPTSRLQVNIQNRVIEDSGALALDLFGGTFQFARREVPEPASTMLLGMGLLASLALRRRS